MIDSDTNSLVKIILSVLTFLLIAFGIVYKKVLTPNLKTIFVTRKEYCENEKKEKEEKKEHEKILCTEITTELENVFIKKDICIARHSTDDFENIKRDEQIKEISKNVNELMSTSKVQNLHNDFVKEALTDIKQRLSKD